MLMATATLALPNTLLMAVGIVEKKAPLAAPLITTKTISGASSVDVGQIASIETAVKTRDARTVLIDPTLSDAKPERMRPAAEDRLKPATKPAPTLVEKPSDLVYNGRKNGGTNKGNVPTALPTKMSTNVGDLNSFLNGTSHCHLISRKGFKLRSCVHASVRSFTTYHSINVRLSIGILSFISHAAGRPVERVIRPRMRYAHATPNFWIKESNAKLMAAPPKPLPANMKPLARPRLALKYCDGTVEMTWLVFKVSCMILCVQCITQGMHVSAMREFGLAYGETKTIGTITVNNLSDVCSPNSMKVSVRGNERKNGAIPSCLLSPDTYPHYHPGREKQRPNVLDREAAENLAPTHACRTQHCCCADSHLPHHQGVNNCQRRDQRRLQRPDEREHSRISQTISDQGGLHHAPSICCAEGPPKQDEATSYNDPAVPAFGSARVSLSRGLKNLIGDGRCVGWLVFAIVGIAQAPRRTWS